MDHVWPRMFASAPINQGPSSEGYQGYLESTNPSPSGSPGARDLIGSPRLSRMQFKIGGASHKSLNLASSSENVSRLSLPDVEYARSRAAEREKKPYSESAKHPNARRTNSDSFGIMSNQIAVSYSLDDILRYFFVYYRSVLLALCKFNLYNFPSFIGLPY